MADTAAPEFFSPYSHDFLRLGVCVPALRPADVRFNADQTLDLIHQGHKAGAAILLFPELGLSAYAIDDLLLQQALLDAVEQELGRLTEATEGLNPVVVVGAPLRFKGGLYNCAVALHDGRILGAVPKAYLPNYREFYERRWFTPGADVSGEIITIAGEEVPFGVDILFQAVGPTPFCFHIEICEDIWTPTPPSSAAALAGAEILLNLSASNITIGKAKTRNLLCRSQSERCQAAYAYSAAGPGESTTDLAWDGQGAIFELGQTLAQSQRFSPEPTLTLADLDLGRIRQERLRTGTWNDAALRSRRDGEGFDTVEFDFEAPTQDLDLIRAVERFPYVPSNPDELAENCYEAWNIQVQGLATRLKSTGLKHLVIGVSGGLDSTQALIVAVKVMDQLGLPRQNVLAYTLPGFATSDGTKANAHGLMQALGVSAHELDIRPAAQQMLADLGHPFGAGQPVYDVTFENVQAGLRTDYLFRLANQNAALVVGTGDLSELALGWCTYGVGDHMSHYNPNAGVSKTLIQHLIRFAAASGDFSQATAKLLHAILDTEISPELVPPGADGAVQSTQDMIGPYALQDFTLYYLTRYGFKPSKIAYLAWQAWHDAAKGDWPANTPEAARPAYDLATIKTWMALFLKRFFANQFKRSAVPNSPKISSGGSLSPRGDWRMPSDASAAVWLEELETGVPDRPHPSNSAPI